MSRIEFEEGLETLKRDYSSEIFTPTDILNIFTILESVKPSFPQKDVAKWKRIHDRFKLVSYQGSEIPYLREKEYKVAKRVLSTEELFETLEGLHKVEGNYTGRTRLYKRASEEFMLSLRGYVQFLLRLVTCALEKV